MSGDAKPKIRGIAPDQYLLIYEQLVGGRALADLQQGSTSHMVFGPRAPCGSS